MSTVEPKLWLIAGPNGAGKTTVTRTLPYATLLQSLQGFNPDDISKELLQQRGNFTFASAPPEMLKSTFIEAAELVFERAKLALESGSAICLETVLSTDKYRSLVDLTLQHNGFFGLLYVAVSSPEISARRIAARVRAGGHGVPTDKLAARWQRSLEQLPWFVKRATVAAIYDNSSEEANSDPILIARKRDGALQMIQPDLIPEITQALRDI